jgi:hypothetical protein
MGAFSLSHRQIVPSHLDLGTPRTGRRRTIPGDLTGDRRLAFHPVDIEPSKAVIQLIRDEDEANRLKRLALLFDEIHFTRPTFATVSEEAVKAIEDGGPGPTTIDGIHDIRSMQVMSLEGETEEVLDALMESGVALDQSTLVSDQPENETYLDWRNPILSEAIRDKGWNSITETSPQEYRPTLGKMLIRSDSGEEHSLTVLNQPRAVARASILADIGFLTRYVNGYPVFDREFRPWLSYKYQRYKERLGAEGKPEPAPLAGHSGSFGEAAFSIGNSVFSSRSLEDRSIDEILRFRSEMDIARREFLSRDLMDLSLLIEDDPWSPKASEEMEKFIRGKLSADVAAFDAGSVSTWEKLYGALTIRAVSVGQATGFGTTVGAVTGHILPQTSFWAMLLAGLLAGLSKEAPNVARDLIEAAQEDRERKHSGIAYLADFPG